MSTKILIDPTFLELMLLQEADKLRAVVSNKGIAVCDADDFTHGDLSRKLGDPSLKHEFYIQRNAYLASATYYYEFPCLKEATDWLLDHMAEIWQVEMRRIS